MVAVAVKARTGTSGSKSNPSNSGSYFPTRIYLALFTAAPTVDSNGVVTSYSEPTCGGVGETGSYARVELTDLGPEGTKILSAVDTVEQKVGIYDNPSDPNPSSTITRMVARIRNHAENILFPYSGKSNEAHSGYNAPVTHFGIFDSGTTGSGTLWFYGPLESSVTVPAGMVPVVLKDKLEITFGWKLQKNKNKQLKKIKLFQFR